MIGQRELQNSPLKICEKSSTDFQWVPSKHVAEYVQYQLVNSYTRDTVFDMV